MTGGRYGAVAEDRSDAGGWAGSQAGRGRGALHGLASRSPGRRRAWQEIRQLARPAVAVRVRPRGGPGDPRLGRGRGGDESGRKAHAHHSAGNGLWVEGSGRGDSPQRHARLRRRADRGQVVPRCNVHVEWERGPGEAFVDNRYSRRHRMLFDGGAEVAGSSSPHVVRPPLSDPTAADPEEIIVDAPSSCHLLWFLSLAAQAGLRRRPKEGGAGRGP